MVQKVNFNVLTGDSLTIGNTVIDGTGVTVAGSSLGNNPGVITLFQDGELEATTGTVRWYSPGDISVTKITTRVSSNGNGNTSILIKKNGTTEKTVTISNTVLSNTDNVGFDLNDGEYLTVDVANTGSTPSEDLNIQFLFTYK